MFENIIKKEIKFITDEFKQEKIYLSAILENNIIRNSYKKYYDNLILNQIYLKNIERKSEKFFDNDDPEIAPLWYEIDQLFYMKAFFERSDFETITETAVKLRLNYLCRPRITLMLFCMQGDQALPVEEINRKLNFFGEYNYLIKGLQEELSNQKHKNALISSKEFAAYIDEVDNNHIFNLNTDDLAALALELSEYFDDSIPVEALVIFFDDKNLKPLSGKIMKYAKSKGIKALSIDLVKEFFNLEYNKAVAGQENVSSQDDIREKSGEKPEISEEIPDLEEEKIPELDEEETKKHEHIITEDEDEVAEPLYEGNKQVSDDEGNFTEDQSIEDIIDRQIDNMSDSNIEQSPEIDPGIIEEELNIRDQETEQEKKSKN